MEELLFNIEPLTGVGITQPMAWLHVNFGGMPRGDETIIIYWPDGEAIKYRAKPLLNMLEQLLSPFRVED